MPATITCINLRECFCISTSFENTLSQALSRGSYRPKFAQIVNYTFLPLLKKSIPFIRAFVCADSRLEVRRFFVEGYQRFICKKINHF